MINGFQVVGEEWRIYKKDVDLLDIIKYFRGMEITPSKTKNGKEYYRINRKE